MADTPPIDSSGTEIAPPIVVLTGFMGSGKTTTGRALAELLRWEFIDLDEWIERQEQTSIRELFRRFGEVEFRKIEHRVLESLLAECSRPTVLALGGGTFAQAGNDAILRRAGLRSVFLELSVEAMMQRCVGGEDCATENVRPLASDPARFRELYEERLESYRRAECWVKAELRTPEELAREIVERLKLTAGD
jgi:shikimate kinase